MPRFPDLCNEKKQRSTSEDCCEDPIDQKVGRAIKALRIEASESRDYRSQFPPLYNGLKIITAYDTLETLCVC